MSRRPVLSAWFTVLFIASLATFVQAYLAIKVACVGLFVLTAGVTVIRSGRVAIHGRLVTFYAALSSIAVLWAIVAVFNTGTFTEGVVDAIRLYVAWSAVFVVLFTLLRASPSLALFHRAMVVAALGIATINLVAVADILAGTGLIPESVREPMELYVGVHDGYVQIATTNIGALFLIAPYLLAVTLRRDAQVPWPIATRVALALSLLVAALSGRRALWLVVLATPTTMLLLAAISRSGRMLHVSLMRTLAMLSLSGALATLVVVALPESVQVPPLLEHVRDAFSATDERSLQKPYLLRGFAEEPFLGSGFGAYAGYTRSDERPWSYELTYHKMLFNLGIVGVTLMTGLCAAYFALAVDNLRRWPDGSAIPWALLVGICSLFLGAYSNPYFGSFDYLFFVGVLPYLATFTRGFDRNAQARARP
jgi:hypothetical protein